MDESGRTREDLLLPQPPILVTSDGLVASVNVRHALVELAGVMLRTTMDSRLLVELRWCCRVLLHT